MTPRALFHPARLARRPVLSTQSDDRLVDLVRAGSDPAFEAIVERYRRPLLRYVARLLPPERAEDVVQLSLLNAYEAMRRSGAALNLRPWLYRIAHNAALNALRDRGLQHDQLDERLDGVERPDQALQRTHDLRELLVAVRALPERQRDAILLRELEGRSYEEIALALGVTDGAVRQLLHRARNALRSAAAALTPSPLLTRLASAEPTEPVAGRVAELAGSAGGGALVAKVCATALVTSAVVGGAAVAPELGGEPERGTPVGADSARAASAGGADGMRSPTADGGAVTAGGERRLSGSGGGGSGSGDENRGPSEDEDGRDDSSGPGSGRDPEDSSGGSGDGEDGDSGSSGPGSGEYESGGSGSGGSGGSDWDYAGSGESGTDSSGSGSGEPASYDGSSSSGSGEAGALAEEPDNSGSGSDDLDP